MTTVQYIGETKRQLSHRFGEHRPAIEKSIAKQHIDQPTAVSDHFTLPTHSIDNIELVPLELIASNRDAIRKARKAFLISKGKKKKFDPFIFYFSLYIRFGTRCNISLFLSTNQVTYIFLII